MALTTGTAFLLTRHQRDNRNRRGHSNFNVSSPAAAASQSNSTDIEQRASTELVYWGWTESGPARFVIEQQPSLFFIESSKEEVAFQLLQRHSIHYQEKRLTHTNFVNNPVTALYFFSLDDAFKAQGLLKSVELETFEHDIRLHDRYLIERSIRGGCEFIGEAKSQPGYTEFRSVRLRAIQTASNRQLSPPNFKVISLDIECSMQGELYSIGLYGHQRDYPNETEISRLVIMIGDEKTALSQIESNSSHEQANLEMSWVKDEYQLLLALEHHIQRLDPDIIIGWNVINFDFRLLITRAKKHNLSLRLGRGMSLAHWRDSKIENNQGLISLPGRVVIDGIDGLKSATYHFESFSLEYVAQALLQRGKLTESVDHRADQITHDFHHNKLKLATYNLEDCKLVWDIFEHTHLLNYLTLRSQLTGLELDKVGGSVAAFTNLYLPKLHRAGYIAPNLPPDGGLASPGGYVMNSKPGFYKNVLVLDFKSLYPSIIRTFKVDPMGLVEGLKQPEIAIPGFKGAAFSRNKHFLPDIITELWQQRDQAKKEQDSARSQAIKIIMNSFYGVLGSGGCRFYDTRLASSITMRGHEIMQQTASWIEAQTFFDKPCEVIYGDTDSTFVLLDNSFTADQCEFIGQQLVSTINKAWIERLKNKFDIESHLEIEFETHYQRFLMPTIRGSAAGSKKRYAGKTIKNGQPQLIFKGLETVRTDWTDLARDFQQKLYQIIFNDDDPTSYILDTVHSTLNGMLDKKLIYRKRLRQSLSNYVKNIPPHARAAQIADTQNRALGKPLQYQHKGWINYLITLNGPEPIEYQNSDIDYQHYLDKQLKPIADGILPFIGMDFNNLIDQQMALF